MMRKWIQRISCAFSSALLLAMLAFTSVAAAEPHAIKVGLVTGLQKVFISADCDFEIWDKETGRLLITAKAGKKVIVMAKGSNLLINDLPETASSRLKVVKVRGQENGSIEVSGSLYRGDIDIQLSKGKASVQVINTLPLEQYLYGVVGREISPEWHLETVKAQSVAARTYAMHNMGKHYDEGFDVCDTTDCQVYGGLDGETPRVRQAVDETAGQVITYQGKLIAAYFHSSSGGYTENSENVWYAALPYLRGVPDYDQQGAYYKWEKRLTAAELATALQRAGYQIGSIVAIELQPLNKQPSVSAQRGVSGRVKDLRIIGTTGIARLSGDKLRSILRLKSTLFDISIEESPPIITTGKTAPSLLKASGTHTVSGAAGESILIRGQGFGHGIGLSQWGAKAMAERYAGTNSSYYKEILKHYYQGTVIQKIY